MLPRLKFFLVLPELKFFCVTGFNIFSGIPGVEIFLLFPPPVGGEETHTIIGTKNKRCKMHRLFFNLFLVCAAKILGKNNRDFLAQDVAVSVDVQLAVRR